MIGSWFGSMDGESELTSRVWWCGICQELRGRPLLIPGGSGLLLVPRLPLLPALTKAPETPAKRQTKCKTSKNNLNFWHRSINPLSSWKERWLVYFSTYQMLDVNKNFILRCPVLFLSTHLHVQPRCWRVSLCWRWWVRVVLHTSGRGVSWKSDWGYERLQAEEHRAIVRTDHFINSSIHKTMSFCLMLWGLNSLEWRGWDLCSELLICQTPEWRDQGASQLAVSLSLSLYSTCFRKQTDPAYSLCFIIRF